jgi:DNA-binding NarL/FixJ family response regulator
MIRIGIVDDHQLFLKSLGLLITSIGDMEVSLEALDGKDLINKLQTAKVLPDIMLIDVNMPVMDGRSTAAYIHKHYPQIKLVALSMKNDDSSVLGMLREGCCAYLLKDIHPNELEKAIHEIDKNGYYNADAANLNFRRLLLQSRKEESMHLTDREKQFIQLACSDLTYKQIANDMHVSERTVDGYREALFGKLNVQSRVGLALEAIRRNLATL